MKTRVVILAGGEGTRLSVLTTKRAKPAVPFAGKYRIIDFALSNCVNSGLVDVMVLAQYRPHSLVEHIGAGGPWDLNRDFTGGVRIYTPYTTRNETAWYSGTADAVQRNFSFIKQSRPELVLILSGDHIYAMNYASMIAFHTEHDADLTIAAIRVPMEEASRFGILQVDESSRVVDFVEKPANPPSNLANMGVYLFRLQVLNQALLEDHFRSDSSHDFGKDILPRLVREGKTRVYAFPYSGYWVDVGTLYSYWQAHMDLLQPEPPINLRDRSWIIHTRTEERPPARILRGAQVWDSLISDGCVIEPGAIVERSVLSPGVVVRSGAQVRESILLTDTEVAPGARVERSIVDKRVWIAENAWLGDIQADPLRDGFALVGKNTRLPAGIRLEPGTVVGTDVIPSDFESLVVSRGQTILTKRKPYEI